ncbi:hypothetical protein JCM8547_000654 [Rhodosporidiobolus lusitaniae]
MAETNPYTYYLKELEAQLPQPSDKKGLEIRLYVIFTILAYTFVASVVNGVVHLYSNRLKQRGLWLFRLVRRQGGTHIVSNHFVLSGLTGLLCMPVLVANATMVWRAFVANDSDMDNLYALSHMNIYQFSTLPMAYSFGWLLSWATFQSFLQVEGGRHRSRFTMPAWLENLAFVGGGVVTVGALVVLVVLAALANNRQWDSFESCATWLASNAATYDGSALSSSAQLEIAERLAEVSDLTNKFYIAAEDLSIAGAILPFFLVVLNAAMLSFVHSIRKQVSLQLRKFTVVAATQQEDDKDAVSSSPSSAAGPGRNPSSGHSLPSPEKAQPFSPVFEKPALPSGSLEQLPTFINLPHHRPLPPKLNSQTLEQLASPTSPTSPSRAVQFLGAPNEALASPRSAPTRSKIRSLSQNPDRLARDQAERLMAMFKAEQELLIMSVSVFFIALSLVVWCAWSAPTLRDHANLSWSQEEGLLLAPIWFYGVGLAFAESLHAWTEWVHLKPWRAGHIRSRSRTGSSSNGSQPGSSVAVVPSEHHTGLATAVHVEVQVVTQHEVVELDNFERSIGVALGGDRGDEKKRGGGGDDASFDEEKSVWSAPRGMKKPTRNEVWRD